MTIEEFNSLSNETKKGLMLHWWHYYGKSIYTLEELEKFESLINNNIEQVLEIAIANYMFGEGPTPLLMAIRKNLVSKMLEVLPNITELSEEAKAQYTEVKTAFINEIIATSGIDLSCGRK